MRTLEKVFYLVLFLITCFVQFGMAQIQDTIGKYLNTKPLEQHTLKDGRILVILDDLWKNTQLVPFENKQRFLLRKGSIALPIAFELPDTVNAWVVDVYFTKYVPGTTPPVDEIINLDNVGPHNVYTGVWTHAANNPWNANHHNKTISYTYIVNATVVVSFTGKKVELFAEKRVNHGIAALSIDGGSEIPIDQYANDQTNNTQKLFEQVLTPGNHTLKLRMTGTKNPLATEANIMFDYIRVTK